MTKNPNPIPFTFEGYQKLKPKLVKLLKKREGVLVELQRAREQGDLSENGAYKAARFELSNTDREIRQLEYQIKYGKAVEPSRDGVIGIGSTVKLRGDDGNELVYKIVGTYEADPLKGLISIESLMGKAIHLKKSGDRVEVNGKRYLILE